MIEDWEALRGKPTHPSLLWTVLILKWKILCPGKPLRPRQSGIVDHPNTPQALRKDKGSQMTISVHEKVICSQNFSLYDTLNQ